MKVIRTAFIIILFILTGSSLHAQDLTFSVTAHAGANLSNMDVQEIKTNPKFGYKAGVSVEFNLPKKLFIQTGVDLTTKGAKRKWTIQGDLNGDGYFNDKVSYAENINTTYLILPIRAGYRLSVSDIIRMNLSLGPYFGYGIGGKMKSKSEGYMGTSSGETEAFSDEYRINSFSQTALKRFDMGLSGNVGIEYQRLLLNVGYEYGFINHSRTTLSSYNNNLYLTLGYRIL